MSIAARYTFANESETFSPIDQSCLIVTIFWPSAFSNKKETNVTPMEKEYYARRAREERAREQTATTQASAEAHAEMAAEYERKLRADLDNAKEA